MRVFLFGYYGYENFGDELLLRSALKLLKDLPIERIDMLFPQKGSRKVFGLKIKQIPRNSLFGILHALKACDIVIGGGGGIFQDETSGKSFSYYDFIVSTAFRYKKPVYLLGHGIGGIRSEFHYRRLRKILAHPLCAGFFRDAISARYASHFSNRHSRGSDLAYGVLSSREKIRENSQKIGLMLKYPVNAIEEFIEPLKIEGFKAIDLLVSFPKEELRLAELNASVLSKHFVVRIPQTAGGQLIDDIASCSLVITERLHGVIVASYFNIPFVTRSSFKAKAFLRDFKMYRAFYENFNRMEVWGALTELKKFDFHSHNAEFTRMNLDRYQKMVHSFTNTFLK
ncbi:MAG: polysaccharide pyruvyl transferase family protein [Thermotogota bacterium]|nr:polysaccharide pyruvyl transferase family protein [Thermotogota bacterium]